MKIEIRFLGMAVSESLRESIVRRAHLHFSRFGRGISAVTVRIGDINGPKGGVDKRCQVTVRGPAVGTIALEDVTADAYSAVDVAFERAARTAGREIERTRAGRRDNGANRAS